MVDESQATEFGLLESMIKANDDIGKANEEKDIIEASIRTDQTFIIKKENGKLIEEKNIENENEMRPQTSQLQSIEILHHERGNIEGIVK
jgi:hypothetical protein